MNNIVGIKLADGSFYPILEEGTASSKILDLTTVRDNQETVQLDLYKAIDGDETNLEYVDTLLIENLLLREKEEPTLSLTLSLDEDDVLSASIEDAESGESSSLTVSLLNSSEPTQVGSPDFSLANTSHANLFSSNFMDDVPREADSGRIDKEDTFKIHEPFDIDEPTELEDSSFETDGDLTNEDFTIDDSTIDDSTIDVDEDLTIEDSTFDIDEPTELEDSSFETDDDFTIDDSAFDIDDSFEIEEPEIDINIESAEALVDTTSVEKIEDTEQGVLEEDSFPTFPEDLDVSSIETHVKEKGDSINEDNFTGSIYDFGDSISDDLGDLNMKEEDFSTEGLDDSMPAPEFSFSDLYDNKDYKEEDKLEIKEEKASKKTGFIILLLILILLLLGGILFFFWDTLGFGSKEKSKKNEIELFEENRFAAEPSIEALMEEEKTDTAKENEIVKLEAEVVVPEPVRETPVEAEVIAYKIKWGDTLWDISNAYYKTPWLYPKIADYNGIKNPDYIISGTWINIPPK